MSHGLELPGRAEAMALPRVGAVAACARAMAWLNERILLACTLAIVAAALVLTGSVATRYVLKVPTDWQDEASVILMVGATFMSGAYVQSQRGHVGIAALASVLPPRVNRWRIVLADAISFLFCTFFSWKSWTLLHEAVVDGQTTSSTWAPPLWIPYGMMATGMSLVAAQLLLQTVVHFAAEEGRR
ncbi:MAG TPA: TRAP transporter small permease [Anaeromyxobacter sp.]|nr:TRAP transporter small permease [Anaeromyxobacter sp.]